MTSAYSHAGKAHHVPGLAFQSLIELGAAPSDSTPTPPCFACRAAASTLHESSFLCCAAAVQKRLTPGVYEFVMDVLQPAKAGGSAAAAIASAGAPARLKREERTIPEIIYQVHPSAQSPVTTLAVLQMGNDFVEIETV